MNQSGRKSFKVTLYRELMFGQMNLYQLRLMPLRINTEGLCFYKLLIL